MVYKREMRTEDISRLHHLTKDVVLNGNYDRLLDILQVNIIQLKMLRTTFYLGTEFLLI